MTQPALTPVMILLTDRFADWEAAPIADIGHSVHGLPVRPAMPGGGNRRAMGGLHVTSLADATPRADEIIVICGGKSWTTPEELQARASAEVRP